ncbi:BMP family ABC transporter substrate-binding protein [Clostridium sp. 19966]|uniref:BMP family ABC transporter substrate-binding protein n=1 Tax=Clostridium sp. 19966 TaxID=2768166 RepID=UPI0028DE7F28|nr:BMP family ABC transporter substrate-binding protein [Clostridium sp. 19966]MDT8718094.1 BMP family ABC transporter substrate-binding protein [Clostridium sp. 19966]
MEDKSVDDYYLEARKLGQKEYSKSISRGESGYLLSLEGVLKNIEIVSEVNLGIIEIPLKKIRGTYSHLRGLSLSKSFYPLLPMETEFGLKWRALCRSHLGEGIKHSIKVYEYMNWFYVIEGNKRVSVLKYFGAFSISADVTRLVPKKDENDIDNCIYYEFLKFNKITGIFLIYFSESGSFDKLLKLLDKFNPAKSPVETKYEYFEKFIYKPFADIYAKLGGDKLSITTGDAFLEYTKIYGIPKKIDEHKIIPRIRELLIELEHSLKFPEPSIQTSPIENSPSGVLSTLTNLILPKKKKLKVAFAYAKTIESSGWTYAHEIGRRHIEKIFGDQIQTTYIENLPQSTSEACKSLQALVDEGYNVIFTTSPIYKKATLKCAMNNTNVRFFNCSEYQPYLHVANYFGRTFEPRFLTGIIAGSMTKSNILGYVATTPAPEVISSINAFTLGAKLVNPYAKVKVNWTNDWNSGIKSTNVERSLIDKGADIISNQNILSPQPITNEYGVYSMLSTINQETFMPEKYLAAPIWKWGIFYEKIINLLLNDTLKALNDIYRGNVKMVNFWWGMAAGVLDIYYSKEYVPESTQKLVEVIRKMITESVFHPFMGPIYDNKGNLMVEKEEIATHQQILSMNWFVEDVEAESSFKL